jgi:hypothetical protein
MDKWGGNQRNSTPFIFIFVIMIRESRFVPKSSRERYYKKYFFKLLGTFKPRTVNFEGEE